MARKKRRKEAESNRKAASSDPFDFSQSAADQAMLERHIQARHLLMLVDPQENPTLAIEAAKKAIAICDDCMEAHMRLGELETNTEKVALHYQKAAQAGAWMLDVFDEEDLLANPPRSAYVYFRVQMSDHLWSIGQRVEAVEHLTAIYQYDMDDAMESGTRLLFRLLDLGWDREFQEYVEQGVTVSNVAAKLLLDAMVFYRDELHEAEAITAIQLVSELEPLLLEYLLGMTPLPLQFPLESDEMESEDSVRIAHLTLPTARSLPGFMRWIREHIQALPDRSRRDGSLRSSLAALMELEQVEEEWIVDCRKVKGSWLFLAFVQGQTEPLRIESLVEKPTTASLWELVYETMLDAKGNPRRPTTLGVGKKSLVKAWHKRCAAIDIDCVYSGLEGVPQQLFTKFMEVIKRVERPVEFDESLWSSLLELPQYDATWIVGSFQPPLWINDGATPRRPWIALVLDVHSGLILMQEIAESPDAELPLRTAVKAMLECMSDNIPSHRPAQIVVHHRTDLAPLQESLTQLEIEVALADEEAEQLLHDCMESMIRQMSGPENRQALLDAEGVTPSELANLYQSAARFWKVAPWRLVGGDRPIEIQSPVFEQAWYAVIVGQLGMNLGVVLYDQKEAVEEMMNSKETMVEPDGVFLNYLEQFEIPSIDLWNQEKFGWSIASEEAYPLIERALPHLKHRRPNRSELLALDVVLRILPAFVTRPESEEAFTIAVESFEQRTQASAKWM